MNGSRVSVNGGATVAVVRPEEGGSHASNEGNDHSLSVLWFEMPPSRKNEGDLHFATYKPYNFPTRAVWQLIRCARFPMYFGQLDIMHFHYALLALIVLDGICSRRCKSCVMHVERFAPDLIGP